LTSLCMLFEVDPPNLHYMTDRQHRFDRKMSKLKILWKQRHLQLGCPWGKLKHIKNYPFKQDLGKERMQHLSHSFNLQVVRYGNSELGRTSNPSLYHYYSWAQCSHTQSQKLTSSLVTRTQTREALYRLNTASTHFISL